MIIDAIKLYSAAETSTPTAEFVEFSLSSVNPTSSYILQQGWGLDLDEIFPHLYGSYNTDNYVSMTQTSRLIVLKIRLNPQAGQTPSSLRDALYKLIAKGRTGVVDIRLMNNATGVATISGRIKKFEADVFSAEPVIQISIECPDSFFKAINYLEFSADGVSTVTVPSPILIDNVSTAPHGFYMDLAFTGTLSSFTIQGKYGTTEWPFRIEPASSFLSGDHLHMRSEKDNKELYVVRASGGTITQLFDRIDLNQIWPMIFPGSNRLGFSSSSVTITSLKHKYHYWGV